MRKNESYPIIDLYLFIRKYNKFLLSTSLIALILTVSFKLINKEPEYVAYKFKTPFHHQAINKLFKLPPYYNCEDIKSCDFLNDEKFIFKINKITLKEIIKDHQLILNIITQANLEKFNSNLISRIFPSDFGLPSDFLEHKSKYENASDFLFFQSQLKDNISFDNYNHYIDALNSKVEKFHLSIFYKSALEKLRKQITDDTFYIIVSQPITKRKITVLNIFGSLILGFLLGCVIIFLKKIYLHLLIELKKKINY